MDCSRDLVPAKQPLEALHEGGRGVPGGSVPAHELRSPLSLSRLDPVVGACSLDRAHAVLVAQVTSCTARRVRTHSTPTSASFRRR